MSRTHRNCDSCRGNDSVRLAPGSGLAIATAIGLGGMVLGIAVFLSGAGLGWALLTWLAASPCGLAIILLPTPVERQSPSASCAPGACRLRRDEQIFGRLANV